MRNQITFIIFSCIFLLIGLLLPDLIELNRIEKVIDGDTIIVAGDIIRLARIDTPEYGEDGFWKAKSFMDKYLYKKVKLDCQDEKGYYGRDICEVYYNDKSINQILLDNGLAVEYK